MIKLHQICRNFQQGKQTIQVLKSINLEIDAGEFIAIIGQSGSGKSTLMNIIGCLDMPSSGEYIIDQTNTSNMTSDELATLRREKFGFIFQRYNLLASLTALDNVILPAVYSGMNETHRKERATTLLGHLGLEDKILNKPNELSGGQQQRVSIARALMNGGQIILADEPTGALDSKSGEQVMSILSELHQQGHTIILVTHDAKVANYANRIVEIKDGEIIRDQKNQASISQSIKKDSHKKENFFTRIKTQLSESFKMSLQAIKAHRMRSFLTMLGIIIGITSVVCVSAIGEGTKKQILSTFNTIGHDVIFISSDTTNGGNGLTMTDVKAIRNINFVNTVAPSVIAGGLLQYKNKKLDFGLTGIDSNEMIYLRSETLSSGRLFTQEDFNNAKQVVIINKHLEKSLFPNESGLGKIIRFNKLQFKVIGITQDMEHAIQRPQKQIYTPNTTILQKITGNQENILSSITVYGKPGVDINLIEKTIEQFLIVTHGIKDFEIISTNSIIKTIEKTTGILSLMISSIAFISLVVGGIGVMNIMLVSVSERTREIGIRMAIGARQSNIKQQFIIEAILLCLISGLLALILSLLISLGFNHYMTLFNMSINSKTMIIALFASTSIGLIFGYIPAKNAAKLNPIQALSNE